MALDLNELKAASSCGRNGFAHSAVCLLGGGDRRGYVIKKGEHRVRHWADPGMNIDSVTYELYRFGQVISHV